MKKHWKALIGLLVCFAILATCVVGFFMSNNMLQNESKHSAVSTNLSGSLNDEDFVILEIVPDKSYAQLGYLQEGEEPINILKACKDGKAAEIAKVAGNGVKLIKQIDAKTYERLTQIYGDMEQYWETTVSGSAIKSKNKYTFVNGESFVINTNSLASTLASKVGTDEEIVVKTVTAKELNNASDLDDLLMKVDFVYISESYVNGAEDVQKKLAKEYAKDKEDIKEDTITFTTKDYDADWKVVKAIFKYVGDKENPLPIMMDKTIYTDGLEKDSTTVDTYQYELNRSVKYTGSSWNVNGDLFKKRSDWKAGSGKASKNNMYKLYLMTMFRDPAEFYNLFIESELVNSDGKYALQDGDAASCWNPYTFLPCEKEIKHSDHEKGTESFWKNKMAITLSVEDPENWKDEKWINCNALSFEKNTASSFVNAKKEINAIYNYKPKSCMDGRTYNVLELQPARAFSLTEAEIEQMLPYTSYSKDSSLKLQITQMTTSEFVGKIDTLASKYDMIYIGKEIGGFHQKDGETYFGSINSDMSGKIYVHSGAKVPFNYANATDESSSGRNQSNGYALFADGESGNLRYAGNDITELKKNELKTYLDTGLPIVVADGLIADAQKTTPQYFDVYNNVDNNMREFLKENAATLLSLDYNYRDADVSEDEQKKLSRLTKRKPTLTINSLTAGTNTYKDLSKCQVYEFKKEDENRRFTFSYKVNNPEDSNADFVLNLYVDKNADGRFVSTERVGGKTFKANGNDYGYTFGMNPNYSGAFTWKLEVYPRNNPGMICSQVGYSTIRFTDVTEAQTVYVLQVQAVKGDQSKHATGWGYDKAQQIHLNESTYLKDEAVTKDYDIKIIETDLQHFTYGVGANSSSDGSWWDDVRGEQYSRKNLEDKYNMIIFGFADSYRDMEFNKVEIAEDLQDYIDAGKSVLFTHDLTSQINASSIMGEKDASNSKGDDKIEGTEDDGAWTFMETTNGKGFNQWMRDTMGLDRYDQGKRVSSTTKQCSNYTKTGTNEYKYGFTYTALMQYSNFRRNWNTSGKNQEEEWFGPYKNLYINLLARNNLEFAQNKDDDPGKGWPYIGISSDSASTPDDGNAYVTSRVTKVNDGQITKYPFDLSTIPESEGKLSDGTYKIAKTHGQAYQLNVESDDVVCWFALSDKANSSGTGWYSASPNDVSNNYYIYNKGNVTYTGVGHSSLDDMTPFEEKLFVNTIIAALRAGVEGPQPQITNGYNIPKGAEDCYVVYADVDADSEEEDFKATEDVEFYATDDSTKVDDVYVSLAIEQEDGEYKNLSDAEVAKYKLEDENGNIISAQKIKEKDGSEEVWAWKIKKTDLANASGEHTYTVKYPRNVLQNSSSQNFKVYAYSYVDETTYKIKGYQYGALMRRALFKLD